MGNREFTISTGDLDAAGRDYVFPIRASWMRGALEEHEATAGASDGKVILRASKSGTDVVVHGTLSATLSAPCARCLGPVTIDIHEPVSVLFAHASGRPSGDGAPRARTRPDSSQTAEKEREISSEEADTLPYDGETVVLDDLVRDELILATPSFPLCSEDCPGMSPSLTPKGEDRASPDHVDPRLSPLRRLFDPKE